MLRSLGACTRRFRKKEDGATAVEFALVVVPFLGLTIAILELGTYFFASRFLEDAVFRAGRRVMTGQIAGSNCADLRSAVQAELTTLIDPTKVTVSASPSANFGSATAPVNTTSAGCSLGTGGSIIVLTANYAYPFTGFRFSLAGPQINKDMPVTASTAFRREP